MVVTHTFHFMLCQSSSLSTVISFVYTVQRQMVVRWKHASYFLYGKYLKKNSFIPSPHWIEHENLVMQLKRQSIAIEAWQNEKHYSKGNNTSENPESQDKKFQTSWLCEVRRSGQVTTFVVCAVFSLSFQAVMLLTKNCYKSSFFFNQVCMRWVDGLKKFQQFWVKELLLYKLLSYERALKMLKNDISISVIGQAILKIFHFKLDILRKKSEN